MKNIFLLTPSKPGVLLRKTFFHTPDEARSVGLAKACVLLKDLFCYREIRFKRINLICTQAFTRSSTLASSGVKACVQIKCILFIEKTDPVSHIYGW